MSTLYERDFYGWCLEQSDALAVHQIEKLDFINLWDEVNSLGEQQKQILESRLTILFMHLIKWKMQRDQRDRCSGSWLGSIKVQRSSIKKHLSKCPSLKSSLEQIVQDAYEMARTRVPLEAPIVEEDIPLDMSFTLEQALDENWMPE